MKQRLNTLDVKCVVEELKSIVGMRINNVYDGNEGKIIFLKVNKSGEKKLVFIDSGIRLHLTDLQFKVFRDFPTSFVSKLRKHLKNKRIVEIKQLGCDRIISFQLGEGDFMNYLIVELHSSGNVILLDKDYKILSQLRRHIYDEENRWMYPYEKFSEIPELNENPIYQIIQKSYDGEITDFDDVLRRIIDSKGYILMKNGKCTDFTKYLTKKHQDGELKEFDTLNMAIDYYFQQNSGSKTEQKVDEKKIKQKKIANKSERKEGHLKKQTTNLLKKTDKLHSKAYILEENIEFFHNFIEFVKILILEKNSVGIINNEIVESGFVDTEFRLKVININQKDKFINLEIEYLADKFKNTVDLYYLESIYYNISRYHTMKKHNRHKYNKALDVYNEEQEKNLKEHTRKNNPKDGDMEKLKLEIQKIKHKDYWYNGYHWFYSNDGFLVILGRNAEQNEQVCKKYLEKNDIYVHGDFHGCGSCVIKSDNKQIPISTLEQAGAFCLCFSKAWTTNIIDKCYWVTADQVSKTAPSGEYLTTGSMMIRGKKNYLSYPLLELSVGIIFKTENCPEFKIALKPDDKVVESKIMIAPTRTLTKAQYKSKIVPGNMKRNRTLENIIGKLKTVKTISNEKPYVWCYNKTHIDNMVPQKSKKV